MLLGENGTGKSTLLRSLALLMSGSDALPELLGNSDQWVRHGAETAELSVDYQTADGATRSASLEIARRQTLSEVLTKNRKSLQLLDDAIHHSPRNYLTVGYGVSRRLGGNANQKSMLSEQRYSSLRAQSVATLFSSDAPLNSFEAWALDLDYRKGSQGVDLVRAIAREFLPGVEFSRIDKRNRRLLFKTVDGIVPLAQLSDGYQNVAAWCGDLVYRITETFQDYKKPLEARGLLLVDEIDLHLHPVWQRQLRKFLNDRLPNFQIVATTHSALTARQCGPEELFVLKREGRTKAPTLHQFDGDPQKLMVHQLLLSDVFGLHSLDSPQIQHQKEIYRALARKTRKTASERKELASLQAELDLLPDWTRENDRDRDLVDLLYKVRAIAGKTQKRSRRAQRAPVARAKLRKVGRLR